MPARNRCHACGGLVRPDTWDGSLQCWNCSRYAPVEAVQVQKSREVSAYPRDSRAVARARRQVVNEARLEAKIAAFQERKAGKRV